MDQLVEIVTRKRLLMGLKEVPTQSDEFLSDLRHLAFCTFLVDQNETSEGTPALINLEALDKDQAKEIQRKREGEWQKPGNPLVDILDEEHRELVEITFTSGELSLAMARKRRKQTGTVVVVLSENLDHYICSRPDWREREIVEALGVLSDFMALNGIRRRLNTISTMHEQPAIEIAPIADQLDRIIERTMVQRDFAEAMKKIAMKKGLEFSTKGMEVPEIKGEGTLWLDPIFAPTNSPFVFTDAPYSLQAQNMLEKMSNVKTNGKMREEALARMIEKGDWKVENGELSWVEPDNMGFFRERLKKPECTLDEALENGEVFIPQPIQKPQSYGKLGKMWYALEEFIRSADRQTINAFLSGAEERLHSLGVAAGALHRCTTSRILRPLFFDGKAWGLIFKSRSKAGDTDKEAYAYMIVFGRSDDPELNNTYEYNGEVYDWHIRDIKTLGSWVTQMICANKTRIWPTDPEIEVEAQTIAVLPFSGETVVIEGWRAIALDQMFHLSNGFRHSPACEAGEAMFRKMVELVHAKNEGRAYGAVLGFGGMCKEMKEISENLSTACDFRVFNLCVKLMQKLM